MVHALVVRVTFADASFSETFIANFRELYWHSQAEANTLTYELHRPQPQEGADDAAKALAARQLLILERYPAKTHLVDEHLKSAAFQKFSAWAGEHVGKEIESLVMEHAEQVVPARPEAAATAADATAGEPQKAPAAAEAPRKSGAVDVTGDGIMVFCGARTGASPLYVQHSERVAELIVAAQRPLVYGGGTVGVMGGVARGVEAGGGKVIGVIPEALSPREASGQMIGEVHKVATMAERKELMFSLASWLICLPGGIGTLDELFEVLTLCQLGAYRCRIALLNTENFYGPLMAMLHHLVAQGFLEQRIIDHLLVRDTPDDLFAAMADAPTLEAAPEVKAMLKW